MSRNRLYLIIGIACAAGYGWFLFSQWFELTGFTPCLVKNITGFACPSCGVTRSLGLLLEGNLTSALMMNPLGIILALLMIVIPVWLIIDITSKSDRLFRAYVAFEKVVSKPPVAAILILLVVANWIWNIQKNL